MIQIIQAIGFAFGWALSGPPPAQAPSVVPVETGTGDVYVKVLVNGSREATFMLDTAAAQTYVTQEFAKAVGAPRVAGPSEEYTIDRLQLGSVSAASVRVGVKPAGLAKGDHDLAGKPVVGNIGLDVLGNVRMGLDYRLGLLAIWPADAPIGDVLSSWFAQPPLLPDEGKPDAGKQTRKNAKTGPPFATCMYPTPGEPWSVELEVGGTVLDFKLDTGSVEHYIDALPMGLLQGARKTGQRDVDFWTGTEKTGTYQVGPMSLGGKRVDGDGCLIARDGSGPPLAAARWLGSQLFSRMRSLWDFSGRVFYFAPYAGSKLEYSPTSVEESLAAQDRPRITTPAGPVQPLQQGVDYVSPGCRLRGARGLEIFGASAPRGGIYVVVRAEDIERRRSTTHPGSGPGPWICSMGGPLQIAGDGGPVHIPSDWVFTVPEGWTEASDPFVKNATLLVPPGYKGKVDVRKETRGIKPFESLSGHGGVFGMMRLPDGGITVFYNDGTVETMDAHGNKKTTPHQP